MNVREKPRWADMVWAKINIPRHSFITWATVAEAPYKEQTWTIYYRLTNYLSAMPHGG